MSTHGSSNRKKKFALLAGALTVTVAVGIGAVFAVRAATQDDAENQSRENLADLSVEPHGPRWYFDDEPRARTQAIGGNGQVVAIASQLPSEGRSTVAFVDTETGEARSEAASPDDGHRFGLCAVVDSGSSAACTLIRSPSGSNDPLIAFIDVATGSIRRTVETDGHQVLAYQNRFFAIPFIEDRNGIDVYDADGSHTATLPGGDIYPRWGLMTSVEETGESNAKTLVVHDLDTLEVAFRHEFELHAYSEFSPFAGGFAVDTGDGVAYVDNRGSLMTTVQGARIAFRTRGLDLTYPLEPTRETRLPILTGRGNSPGDATTLSAASPMTGKPLWRWRFSEPFVESATADTVTIRQGVNGKSSVYDIVTGEVLADHLTDTQCLGSDGRRVLVSQLDEDRGYMLRALDRAETVWEIGPYLSNPVVIAGKVYADNARVL
ncbi:hypothetical protein [Gordonia westfalica]|uniref:Uncharacterized protein n=1 Tax=Gordonia westfalica TaxID=158898 RepID=A0A1H2JKQ8_9ACTN|nr:hypothetical protein [Gordonia westfalica]SDU56726.1 hypothetical protein SAMN04488548_1342215 [Gordonia westfalica]